MAPAAVPPSAWQKFADACVRGFHAYAAWLVSITWWRFFFLSILLIAVSGIATSIPPFTWTISERIDEIPAGPGRHKSRLPVPPTPPTPPKAQGDTDGLDITIDDKGVRIRPRSRAASAPSTAPSNTPSTAAPAASGAVVPQPPSPAASDPASAAADAEAEAAAARAEEALNGVLARIPPNGASDDVVRESIRQARESIRDAVREARDARREALDEARAALEEAQADQELPQRIVTKTRLGDVLMPLTMMFIFSSIMIKLVYKGRVQAEAKAAHAEEVAEAESLKRQVVEARMAVMQAQVEPHFLFNTLASIDHLIETDPPRASQMQKNLIALLRASMPSLREGGTNGRRDLGKELDVIRPYLEILKVRMEDRLQTEVNVPDGLLSAEFPPMMLQSLVENAIKHGLEPKPEGGRLSVRAEIVHGKLAVTVADTGLGFGRAPTAGTGTGLANIRERLQLLYGSKAQLKITDNQPSGTVVTIIVPYQSNHQEDAGPQAAQDSPQGMAA